MLYNQAVSNAETILNKQTGPNTAKTAVEQALNNVNSAKHALNGTQNLNNANQAAITAINGASDLNQHHEGRTKTWETLIEPVPTVVFTNRLQTTRT